MALWFGITVMDGRATVSQEVHGPFDDTDEMADAIEDCVEEAECDGFRAMPIAFGLCTNDVPELIQYEEAWRK